MHRMKTALTLLCALPLLLVACTGETSSPEEVDSDDTEAAQPNTAPAPAPKKAEESAGSVRPMRSRAIVN
jgi:hypothetical protein